MPATAPEPWSKKHKAVFKAASGGMPFSLSNSYAQPLTTPEIIDFTRARGDLDLVDAYHNHDLGYTPNGGSLDLREQIATLYGDAITADNILVFAGAQIALQTGARRGPPHREPCLIVGAVNVEELPDGLMPWRLSLADSDLYFQDGRLLIASDSGLPLQRALGFPLFRCQDSSAADAPTQSVCALRLRSPLRRQTH